MANKIQIKRGEYASLPTLASGEFGFCTDTHQMFVGTNDTNYEMVMHELFDAQSVLAATSDNTPAAVTIDQQTVLGRLTGGDVAAISLGISDNNVVQIDDADAASADFARFTAAGLEGRSYSEVMGDLSGQADADFAMNTHKITGVTNPTASQDAATKAYVDSVAQGLNVHDAVAIATTSGITLTGEQTIDDVLTSTSRVLVKDQAAAEENGIYDTTSSGWVRATDMNEDAEVAGSFVFVTGGTVSSNSGWVCTNEPESVVIGTDPITWSQFSDAGYIDAGTGLTKTGNLLGVDGVLEDLDTLGVSASDGQFIVATGAGAFVYESGATVRTSLGLTIGTNVQAYDAELDALAGLVSAANKIPYFTGSETADMFDFKDEDNMASDSATAICSQQSIKKYVDDNITAGGSTTLSGLTDTPSGYSGDSLRVLRVNAGETAVEYVNFASTYLEASPSNDETGKAPNSDWAYDHENATTGVHGAGVNTLLHSASTIDGGSFT